MESVPPWFLTRFRRPRNAFLMLRELPDPPPAKFRLRISSAISWAAVAESAEAEIASAANEEAVMPPDATEPTDPATLPTTLPLTLPPTLPVTLPCTDDTPS